MTFTIKHVKPKQGEYRRWVVYRDGLPICVKATTFVGFQDQPHVFFGTNTETVLCLIWPDRLLTV